MAPAAPAPARRRGFTLIELLVVVAIIFMLTGVAAPIIRSIVRDVRMNNAIARMKVTMQMARAVLSDYPVADRDATAPRIQGGLYTGMAVVARWDDRAQEYELFYAISSQHAADAGGAYLASQSPPRRGYSRFNELEPLSLGSGLRVAGLRRNDAKTSGLELLPSDSLAVCVDASGYALPPAPMVYVNLQVAPTTGGSGPWNTWDTSSYDATGATTGSYAASYSGSGGTGEGFHTSLAAVIVYFDDDLPLDGDSPSGTPWRAANAGGRLVVNPALDPNELLTKTRGRLVMLTPQGGSPIDY